MREWGVRWGGLLGLALLLVSLTPSGALEGENHAKAGASCYGGMRGAALLGSFWWRWFRDRCMVWMRLTGFRSAGVEGVGGTYRYGHIRWTSEGNMVTFTLEVAYKRNITDTSYWKGTAPDLLSQVGDSRISHHAALAGGTQPGSRPQLLPSSPALYPILPPAAGRLPRERL